MYQPNQSTSNYRFKNARSIQNVPSGNQQSFGQFGNYEFPERDNNNQILRHQLPPAHLTVTPMETNSTFPSNVVNAMTSPRTEQHISVTQFGGYPASTSHNPGRSVHGFEIFPKLNAPLQFASPAMLTPQNQIAAGSSRSVRGGSSIERSETGSVAGSVATNRNVALTNSRNTVKKSQDENIRIFTGTVEKILNWHKIYHEYFCYYELIASFISIQEGTVRLQKLLLLRDRNGPVIQVIRYVNDHINVENLYHGQMLRCVGRMVGPNILHGLSIREATPDEVMTVRRMCYISEHAISKVLAKG